MINKNSFKLSVVIPCYNEHRTINLIIDKIINSLNIYGYKNFEIIIVDDCSTDGTKETLKKLELEKNIKVFFHDRNLGKGAAIKTAILHVCGDLLLIQDADLEYDPFDYDKLLLPFFETDADIVYGSRFLGGGKYVRIHFFWHYLANKILTFLCNLFINLNLTDMETGYKVFKSSAIKSIILIEKSFAFEPEVTIKLAKKKYKFYEVPITYNGRSYEEGKKIGLRDAFIALKTIILYSIKK
ncbi:glycosyltransferase family 2 protein [Candidatus Pelagibacter sp.]|nr:glycosyltransferase family 2 protein [Candidatus Pelagibacter sp.]MDC0451756.1 glycosyltransferase family 2 protein [Candidatus Pelagibacter sp.]